MEDNKNSFANETTDYFDYEANEISYFQEHSARFTGAVVTQRTVDLNTKAFQQEFPDGLYGSNID
jgi:hypothetical protein